MISLDQSLHMCWCSFCSVRTPPPPNLASVTFNTHVRVWHCFNLWITIRVHQNHANNAVLLEYFVIESIWDYFIKIYSWPCLNYFFHEKLQLNFLLDIKGTLGFIICSYCNFSIMLSHIYHGYLLHLNHFQVGGVRTLQGGTYTTFGVYPLLHSNGLEVSSMVCYVIPTILV